MIFMPAGSPDKCFGEMTFSFWFSGNKVFVLTLANLHNWPICIIAFHPDFGK